MRKKKLQLVVTFHTTADAMAMEQVCKERNAGAADPGSQINLGGMRACVVRRTRVQGFIERNHAECWDS